MMNKAYRSVQRKRRKNYIAVLRIMGKDLLPDQITRRLGVEPSAAHQCGDLNKVKNTLWDYGRWQYGFGELGENEWGNCLNDLITEFLAIFNDKREELLKITKQYDSVLSIGICYQIEYLYTPSCAISAENIKKLADLNLALDVTAYPGATEPIRGQKSTRARARKKRIQR